MLRRGDRVRHGFRFFRLMFGDFLCERDFDFAHLRKPNQPANPGRVDGAFRWKYRADNYESRTGHRKDGPPSQGPR